MTESSSGSQWKSRFPVARIKKIMQADEDVGKVAQVTPVAISKALELFMDRIIKAVADETKARGARRVTPSHFKQIISTQKQYDFLESLTAEIPLPPSRPSTPLQSAPQPRRRRKQSPSADTPEVAPTKRKRRSPQKESFPESFPESYHESYSTVDELVKSEGDVKSETEEHVKTEERHEEEKQRSKGWFDIVMGSQESSEDEGIKKRKKTAKDEDEDYVP